MSVTLRSMSIAQLQMIAQTNQPADVPVDTTTDGLPPAFVARRSLEQIQAGKPARWCRPFLIVRNVDQAVVGACGFKDIPSDGCVEIGYAVSSHFRKQGVATAAVQALLDLAYQVESVTRVLATIAPANEPSVRVVQRVGFEKGEMMIAAEGEPLVCWYHQRLPG